MLYFFTFSFFGRSCCLKRTIDLTVWFSMGYFSTVNDRSPKITPAIHPKHIRLAIRIRNLTGIVWPSLEFQVSIVYEVRTWQTDGGIQHFVDDVNTDAYRNTCPRVNPNTPGIPSFCLPKRIVWTNPSVFSSIRVIAVCTHVLRTKRVQYVYSRVPEKY